MSRMSLLKSKIDKSVAWLLENGSLPVQYMTHKNILHKDPTTSFMKQLWLRVDKSPEVRRILDRQNRDGSWGAGRHDASEPKYKTTVWMLPLLAEMGYTVKDARIKKACDYILQSWLFDSPVFTAKTLPPPGTGGLGFSQCRFGWYLLALASVGCADHPLAKRGFELMMQRQRGDGGWVSPHHLEARKGVSCPWSSISTAMAMYLSGDKKYEKPVRRAFAFLVGHLERKRDRDFRALYFRGHNLIRELAALIDLGLEVKSEPVQRLLKWLMSLYDERSGCFRYDGKPASEHSAGVDGVSSTVAEYHFRQVAETDWLTYHAVRIMMHA